MLELKQRSKSRKFYKSCTNSPYNLKQFGAGNGTLSMTKMAKSSSSIKSSLIKMVKDWMTRRRKTNVMTVVLRSRAAMPRLLITSSRQAKDRTLRSHLNYRTQEERVQAS